MGRTTALHKSPAGEPQPGVQPSRTSMPETNLVASQSPSATVTTLSMTPIIVSPPSPQRIILVPSKALRVSNRSIIDASLTQHKVIPCLQVQIHTPEVDRNASMKAGAASAEALSESPPS